MRKLMWLTIGFGTACAFASYCYVSWLLWVFAGGMLLALLLGTLSKKLTSCAVAALIVLGISVGCGWFWCYDQAYLSNARSMDGTQSAATVTASDFGSATDYGTTVDGAVTLDGKEYKLRLYLDEAVKMYPGSQISGTFFWRFTASGGEKDPTSHRSEGIFLILYQRGDVTIQDPEEIPARYYPAVWREVLLSKIDEIFPADTAGFAKALLLGDRTDIDYQTNTAFKISGISHIIAVSGLHVSILFGLLYTLTMRRRYLTGLIAIPALLLFAAVVGFTPSVTRACVMQILMLLAMMADREYDPPTALAFAVLVMLGVNPMTVISISFQLSVGCMIGIFLFSGRIRAWLENTRRLGEVKGRGAVPRLKRWFVSSVSVSVSASVITVPLVAYYFGTVSLVSVMTNLLTLWVISFVFYGILLVCLFSFFWTAAASATAWIISWPIRYVLLTARVLSDFPLAAVYTESIYIVIWLVGCYVLLAAFLICKRKYPLVFVCCAAVSLCAAMLLSWTEPLTDDLRVTVLDVGQGQCILLQSEGKTYMVDCGGDSDSAAADKASEYLLSRGIDRLDGIILTHYDADHAGGVAFLLSRIGSDALYIPDVTDDSGTAAALSARMGETAIFVDSDLQITFGAATLTVFASETTNSGNESGLCVLFHRENCDILITGDRGELGELLLLRRTDLPQLDVLIAGHHGSAGSTGEELLAKTYPQTVIISAGENNRYGHPAPELLQRLELWGCTVYRTDQNGTVIYRG